jgi:hypothetical protein
MLPQPDHCTKRYAEAKPVQPLSNHSFELTMLSSEPKGRA